MTELQFGANRGGESEKKGYQKKTNALRFETNMIVDEWQERARLSKATC